MKYARLTKEQFEELHLEFANFLATQSIDKNEWEFLKNNQPAVAEQELDVFSDLIWEGVLSNAKYLEHYSKNHIFLFYCNDDHIDSMVLKSLVPEVNLVTNEGFQWLSENIFSDKVEILNGKKSLEKNRNEAIFDLIRQGAVLSNGELYNQIMTIMR